MLVLFLCLVCDGWGGECQNATEGVFYLDRSRRTDPTNLSLEASWWCFRLSFCSSGGHAEMLWIFKGKDFAHAVCKFLFENVISGQTSRVLIEPRFSLVDEQLLPAYLLLVL